MLRYCGMLFARNLSTELFLLTDSRMGKGEQGFFFVILRQGIWVSFKKKQEGGREDSFPEHVNVPKVDAV